MTITFVLTIPRGKIFYLYVKKIHMNMGLEFEKKRKERRLV